MWARASSSTGRVIDAVAATVRAMMASPWSDSAQEPKASARSDPMGTGSGRGTRPSSSSSVSWEHVESRADGFPPVARHTSASTDGSGSLPIRWARWSADCSKVSGWSSVHREPGPVEGERRPLGEVAPGEHHHRRDPGLGVQHGSGNRLGQLLVLGPAVVEDQESWAEGAAVRGPEGGQDELVEAVRRGVERSAPGSFGARRVLGELEDLLPEHVDGVGASVPREPHHGEAGRLGDHGLDQECLARP